MAKKYIWGLHQINYNKIKDRKEDSVLYRGTERSDFMAETIQKCSPEPHKPVDAGDALFKVRKFQSTIQG